MNKFLQVCSACILVGYPLTVLANPFIAEAQKQNKADVRDQLKLRFYNKLVHLSHEAFLDARRAGVEMESPDNGIRKYNATSMVQS